MSLSKQCGVINDNGVYAEEKEFYNECYSSISQVIQLDPEKMQILILISFLVRLVNKEIVHNTQVDLVCGRITKVCNMTDPKSIPTHCSTKYSILLHTIQYILKIEGVGGDTNLKNIVKTFNIPQYIPSIKDYKEALKYIYSKLTSISCKIRAACKQGIAIDRRQLCDELRYEAKKIQILLKNVINKFGYKKELFLIQPAKYIIYL